MNRILKLTVLGILTSLLGCASLTERKRHQFVLVKSDPPGADIISAGQVMGTTPDIIRLSRASSHPLQIRMNRQVLDIKLESEYQWTESFLFNMVFASFAPAGWAIDFLTGSAWRFKDPDLIKFEKAGGSPKKNVVAIAPPLAARVEISNEAATYWQSYLSENSKGDRHLLFKETLPIFQNAGFEYDYEPTNEQRVREVFFHTKASQLYLSSVETARDKLELRSRRVAIDGTVTQQNEITFPSSGDYFWSDSWVGGLDETFQIIPNTVGLESSQKKVNLDDGVITYQGEQAKGQGFVADSFSYLQALTFSRQQPPRLDGVGRWKFQFVPAGMFLYKKIFFPRFEKLANVDFYYFNSGFGIGPEFGWQSGRHYTYMKFIPMLAYSRVEWDQPGGSYESESDVYLSTQAEIGYLYYLTESVNLRFFARGSSTSLEAWNKAILKINPTTPILKGASEAYSGISIGYTFKSRSRFKK